MNFDLNELMRKGQEWQDMRDALFTNTFRKQLNDFIYRCSGLAQVANSGNAEYLFKKHNKTLGIHPTFQYLAEEASAENERHGNTTHAVYSFHENDVPKVPIRIDITNKLNVIPNHLIGILNNGKRLVGRVDIEFYERVPLASDSKNQELKDVIQDYLVNGKWRKDELEELGNLMALEDLEKIHAEFLVFEDDSVIVGYLGIGNNQPYNISEKSIGYGKNRFYRYDILRVGGNPYEQKSRVKAGKDMGFTNNDFIYPETTCNGTVFALHSTKGVAILDGNNYRKAVLDQPFQELYLEKELKKNNSMDFLNRQLLSVFPAFDDYLQVFYDPIERTNSFSHGKTIIHLKKRGLLGQGWQAKFNVASDLYQHGHDPVLRIKPSLILMYHMIETGKLYDLILNTSKSIITSPITND